LATHLQISHFKMDCSSNEWAPLSNHDLLKSDSSLPHENRFISLTESMKYSTQQLNEVLLAATPDQLAELRAISEVFDISMDEVCSEVLKLINAKFPMPNFVFSNS
jgi:hypothetical protein